MAGRRRTGRSRRPSTLERRAVTLAQENADAFGEGLRHLDAPAQGRDADLGRALSRAGRGAVLIAQIAADVAALAKEVAECGDPSVRGDAGAALLAQAAARSAAHLVEINLGREPATFACCRRSHSPPAASAEPTPRRRGPLGVRTRGTPRRSGAFEGRGRVRRRARAALRRGPARRCASGRRTAGRPGWPGIRPRAFEDSVETLDLGRSLRVVARGEAVPELGLFSLSCSISAWIVSSVRMYP